MTNSVIARISATAAGMTSTTRTNKRGKSEWRTSFTV